jgi:hypothetical protein
MMALALPGALAALLVVEREGKGAGRTRGRLEGSLAAAAVTRHGDGWTSMETPLARLRLKRPHRIALRLARTVALQVHPATVSATLVVAFSIEL